ncbi:PEP-CTERM sorting domain-containing protein [Neptunicella marina]|uniref:PEP-CTERM sorting domain-containing protein n=1 Tax=Neptunicella marina TaxID=2125989 RepID=A0A8J6IWL2_9ALTE|nr:PEP-CTERM sorting domain-containing protein [Neptunicella marina]MBC3766932.1 PEP-CTERM sorting domain-containing protein [Neptunicella marina]
MKKIKLALSLCLLLTVSLNTQATLISIGALSSNDDGSTQIIVDTLNNREWLRWDVLASLTYAETVTAISAGGAYEGFTLAGIGDIGLLLNALFYPSVNTCLPQLNNVTCSNTAGITIAQNLALFGNANNANNWTYTVVIDPLNTDSVALLYANGGSPSTPTNSVLPYGINREWKDVLDIDTTHSGSGSRDIGFLLYRSIATVPEPSVWMLMLLGMLIFSFNKRTKYCS